MDLFFIVLDKYIMWSSVDSPKSVKKVSDYILKKIYILWRSMPIA